MDLHHHFAVPAPIPETWDAFNDLGRIGGCLPGATIESVDGDDFTGSVKVKLGPISLLYSGSGTFRERDEAAGKVVIVANGKDKRGNGTASATIAAQLRADGSGTAVEVTTELSITGKPAQFGRGVIQDISDKLIGQFVDCVRDKLSGDGAPSAGTGPATGAESPARTAAGSDRPAGEHDASSATLPRADAGTPPAASGPRSKSEPPAPQRTAQVASEKAAAGSTGDAVAVADEIGPTSETAPGSGPEPAEIDLLSTVGPVLLKRYAKPALAALGVIGAVGWWRKLFHRRSS
jgi:carbon monoxide dehydrogenase subunit G